MKKSILIAALCVLFSGSVLADSPAYAVHRISGDFVCAWHDAQAAVPGEAWGNMVRRYRTEGRRRQGKGMTRKWGV